MRVRSSFIGAISTILVALSGCGDDSRYQAPPSPKPPAPLVLREVDWNGKNVALGQVAAIAELDEDLIVLSTLGAQLFSNGQPQTTDVTIRDWRQGGVIAAADLSGEWLAGLDSSGRIRRLRNRSVMDDVSEKYGLKDVPVRHMAPLVDGKVAFLTEAGLVVVDTKAGKQVRYDGPWQQMATSGHRVALLAVDKVRLLDVAKQESVDLPATGVSAIGFDQAGHLLVATGPWLYVEDGTNLRREHILAGGRGRALVTTREGVWIADGDRLAFRTEEEGKIVVHATPPGRIAQDAKIQAALSGDIWVLSGGDLRRLSATQAGDQELWQRTVLPAYVRRCASCHDPGASSLIDLSTYGSWAIRRKLIEQRVIVGKPTPMPPPGTGTLTEQEIANIKAWITNPDQ